MNTENKQYRSVCVKKHVLNLEDVHEFFDDIYREGLFISPNDFFQTIAESANISPVLADRLNGIMEDCHKICENECEDIYEIALSCALNALKAPHPGSLSLVLSTEGYTEAPDGAVVDNCQLLGIADGATPQEAIDNLFKDNPGNTSAVGFTPEKCTVYRITKEQ